MEVCSYVSARHIFPWDLSDNVEGIDQSLGIAILGDHRDHGPTDSVSASFGHHVDVTPQHESFQIFPRNLLPVE